MNKNKAFTLVEVMIIVVILGLLACMAIPAFQKVKKVKLESIRKAVKIGKPVSADDLKYLDDADRDMAYRAGKPFVPTRYQSTESTETETEVTTEPTPKPVGNVRLQTLNLKGQVYYLIPKDTTYEEIRIKSEYYLLVPAK